MAGTKPKTRFSKVMEIVLWLAGLGVLAENIFLLQQNQRLNEALAPQISAGTQLQMLTGLALDGRLEPVTLPTAGSKLLIITFSPGCPACQANQDGWMRLASTLEQKGVRVLWISRDPIEITRDYCTKRGIRLSDTLADPPFRTFAQLGLARVPNTLLVGAEGRVEKVWAGRLDQAGWNTMFTYFGERPEWLLLSEVRLAPTQPAAGRSCLKRPPKAVSNKKEGEKEMLRRIPKVLLLVALLAAFAASIAPAFGRSHTCSCYRSGDRQLLPQAGCHFEQRALRCVNTSCRGTCL